MAQHMLTYTACKVKIKKYLPDEMSIIEKYDLTEPDSGN